MFIRVINILFLVFAVSFANAADKVSPTTVAGARTVTAEEAKALFDKGVLFIDVRADPEWEAGRIPGAVHIELKKVFSKETLSKQVKANEPVVFYCNGPKCLRSSQASQKAVKWGFTKVNYFRGGIPAWESAGYPIE